MNKPIIALVRGTLLIALISLLTSCSRQEMLWERGDVVTNGDQHNHSFAWYSEMNSVIVLHFPMHLIQELNMPPIIQVGENQFSDGRQVFVIPSGGVLRVQGENPFKKFGVTSVESASGDPVLTASDLIVNDIQPNPGDRLFRIVGSPSSGEEMWAVIGTGADEHAARLKLHDYENYIRAHP